MEEYLIAMISTMDSLECILTHHDLSPFDVISITKAPQQ
jgi:hypothetical protein